MSGAGPDTWMPWYIGDYLSDTTHLTTEQHGAYDLLIMASWKRRGALPDDDVALATICKATRGRWKRLRPIMAQFFNVSDGSWRQKRVGQELAKAEAMFEKRRQQTEPARRAKQGASADSNSPADKSGTASVTEKGAGDVATLVTKAVTGTQPPSPSPKKEKVREVLSPPDGGPAPRSDLASEVVGIWNTTCAPVGFGKIGKLTAGRRSLIIARSKDDPIDWPAVFDRVAKSAFLRGEKNGDGHSNWKADFDWVLQEKHWVKLHEGGFDDARPSGQQAAPPDPDKKFRDWMTPVPGSTRLTWAAWSKLDFDGRRAVRQRAPMWFDYRGPDPTEWDCTVPDHILAEFGMTRAPRPGNGAGPSGPIQQTHEGLDGGRTSVTAASPTPTASANQPTASAPGTDDGEFLQNDLEVWDGRANMWRLSPKPAAERFWDPDLGPPPHMPGTKVPPEILAKYGITTGATVR